MLSLRTVARSAPRAIGRMTAASSAMAARPSALLYKQTTSYMARPVAANFSTSMGRWAQKQGETDEELSAKLDSEIQVEEEMKANEQDPASVKDFLANTAFELIDSPGQEVVKLVRSFGDEKITVSFSIADITSYDPYGQDPALEDEEAFDDETNMQNSNKQSHVQSTGGARSAPAEEDIEGEEDEFDEPPTPISLSILVEKPGKAGGALTIDASAANGNIQVENLHYWDDVSVAKAEGPEATHKRAELYPGPPFGTLDDDLQVLMERYLEERGITQALAVFVPDYVDVKEQKEYVRWLNNIKTFVDA